MNSSDRDSRRFKLKRQPIGLTNTWGEVDVDTFGNPIIGDPTVQLLEGHPQLQPSEVGSEARMITSPERDMTIGVTQKIDIGVWKLGLITVGRSDRQHDGIACL